VSPRDLPDLGPLAKQLGEDLLEILRSEAIVASHEMTPARRKRLEKTLLVAGQLVARQAKGEDVAEKLEGVKAILVNYGAIAAMVLNRGVVRALERGLVVVGRALAILLQAVLAGLVWRRASVARRTLLA
jgi:hypothetical protein